MGNDPIQFSPAPNSAENLKYSNSRVLVKIDECSWEEEFQHDPERVVRSLSRQESILAVRPLINFTSPAKQAEADHLARWMVLELKGTTTADNFISQCKAKDKPDICSKFEKIQHDSNIELLEGKNTPHDPLFPYQWHLQNVGQSYPVPGGYANGFPGNDIKAPAAWGNVEPKTEVLVAVIDTGIDYNHEDIRDNVWINEAELNGQAGVDDDQNGFVDDVRGWDFRNNDNDPIDDHGHGTHVAGIIGAASNNGIGVAGVGMNVKIMPVKFLGEAGVGSESDAISAVYYAIENGAFILNNSYGHIPDYNQAFQDVINYVDQKGGIYVASAGNYNLKLDASTRMYPVCYDYVIGVSAANSWNSKYGTYGIFPYVEINAPGVDILSLRANGTGYPSNIFNEFAQNDPVNGKYYIQTGSSMACPVVVGAMALVKTAYPEFTHEEIIDRVVSTAEEIPESGDSTGLLGNGRVNLYGAVSGPSRPVLYFKGYSLQEVIGNKNTLLDAGETFKIDYVIENWALAPTQGAQGEWVIDSPYISWQTVPFSLGTFERGGSFSGSFQFSISADAPYGEEFYFKLKIADENGYQKQLNFPVLQTWERPSSADSKWEKIVDVRAYFDFGGVKIQEPVASDFSPITLYDVDKDGREEIFFSSWMGEQWVNERFYQGSTLFACDAEGRDLPGWPILVEFEKIASYFPMNRLSPALGDIDGDKVPELVFHSINNKKVFAWDLGIETKDGLPKMKKGFPLQIPFSKFESDRQKNDPDNYFVPTGVLANVWGDGALEIVVRDFNNLYAFDGSGRMVKKDGVRRDTNNFARQGIFTAAKLNIYDDKFSFAFTTGDLLFLLDNNLKVKENFPIIYSDWIASYDVPAFGDVDLDGKAEIVTSAGDKIQVVDYKGNSLPGWPVTLPEEDIANNFMAEEDVSLADVNNDGLLEIISPLAGRVRVWDYRANEILSFEDFLPSRVIAANLDADPALELIWSEGISTWMYNENHLMAIKSDGSGPVRGFPKTTNYGAALGIPAVGDLDGNGFQDILSISDKVLIVWEHSEAFTPSTRKTWPLAFHDPANSNAANW